jgi:type I restriction enzyme S subunit
MKAVPLEDVAELNPRLAAKLSAYDEVAFVPMAALSAEAASVTAEETRTYAQVAKGYTSFASGDVLVAKITPCFENGKIAQTSLSKPVGFGSTEFHVVRPRPGKLDGRYAHHFLRLENVRTAGERRMTGSGGQRRVPENYLAKLQIPLPPLDAQRRIATVLDKADELRAKRRAALAELDTLTQSIFLETFGNPYTNPKNWPVGRLHTGCSLVNGRAFKPEEWEESGMPIIRIQNLNDQKKPFNYTRQLLPERFRVRTGDILFSWSGTPGTSFGCFRWKGPEGWLNQHIFNVRLGPEFEGEFFITQVNLKLGELIAKAHGGVGLQHVTKGMIDETELMVPPIQLQREFARRVIAVEALKSKHRTALAELDTLFASLQHRAFRGEL